VTDTIQNEIRDHIVRTYAPELVDEGLPLDYNLLTSGIVDSLALLGLIDWLQRTYGFSELGEGVTPDSFSTVAAITAFVSARSTTSSAQ
jgi:acyl carrier protein